MSRPMIRRGSRSAAVTDAHCKLDAKFHPAPRLMTGDTFGPLAEAAVIRR